LAILSIDKLLGIDSWFDGFPVSFQKWDLVRQKNKTIWFGGFVLEPHRQKD